MKKILLPLVLLFTACATKVDFNVPTNRFDTPETKGKTLGGDIGIGYGDAHKVTTASVVADIIFNTFDSVNTNTAITDEKVFAFHANLGILSRFDLFYKSYSDSPTYYGGKFQFLGAPSSEAKEGFKASIAAAFAHMNESDGNLTVSNSSGTTRTYTGDVNVKGEDYSLNIGYRFRKNALLYLNNYYSTLKSTSSLTSPTYGNQTIRGDVTSQGTLLGAKLGDDVFIIGEVGVSKMRWEESIQKKIYPVGLFGGFSW